MKLVYENLEKPRDGSVSEKSSDFGLPEVKFWAPMESSQPDSPVGGSPSPSDSEDPLDCCSEDSTAPDDVFAPQPLADDFGPAAPRWEPYAAYLPASSRTRLSRSRHRHHPLESPSPAPHHQGDFPHPHHRGPPRKMTVKRIYTNSRERWRQQTVNGAYADLRRLVPTHPPDKKLSKNEILRLAIKYINLLSSIVDYQKKQDPSYEDSGSSGSGDGVEAAVIKAEPDTVSEASSPASSLSSVSSHTDGMDDRVF